MRTGINDKVVEKQIAMQNRAIAKIVDTLKGEKPFASKEIDPQLKLWVVNNLGTMDIQELVQEFGEAPINKLIYEAKMLEKGRRTNA